MDRLPLRYVPNGHPISLDEFLKLPMQHRLSLSPRDIRRLKEVAGHELVVVDGIGGPQFVGTREEHQARGTALSVSSPYSRQPTGVFVSQHHI
jgi:hypothetical protein